MAKAFLTDMGLETTVHGQQIFGGHGFVGEWGQEQLIRDNFSIIEINQQLRQTLGNHLIVMLTDDNRSEALAPLRQSFQQTLERGIAEANDDVDRQAFRAVASAYAAFLQQIEASRHQNLTLLEDNPLSQSFNKVRGLMTDMQGAAYDKIRDTELRSRDRTSLLAGMGLALLGTQVILRAREAFGVELGLRHLFEAQTVALLAETIEQLIVEQIEAMSDEDAMKLLAG